MILDFKKVLAGPRGSIANPRECWHNKRAEFSTLDLKNPP
jgi:hypothetical protein